MANWGVTSTTGTTVSGSNPEWFFGLDALTESGTLDYVYIRTYIGTASQSVRAALYEGVSANTPAGATLVVDLGQKTLPDSTYEWTQWVAGSQSLTSGKEYWIGIKASGLAASLLVPYFTTETGNSLHISFYGSDEDNDETDPWDATVANPTGQNSRSHCAYITYTPTAGGGSEIAPKSHFLRQQQGVA